MEHKIKYTITWSCYCCFLQCQSVPETKVRYNIDEALDYLLESDEEDLGQLEDDNDGDSSTDSEYNGDDNIGSVTINVFHPRSGPGCRANGICCKGGKIKAWKKCCVISLDTFLNKTNYDGFDPPISKECLESNIDKAWYKLTTWKVSIDNLKSF